MLEAKVIREVIHMQWLANPVLVKKSNRKWRMCIDFTKLNMDACYVGLGPHRIGSCIGVSRY